MRACDVEARDIDARRVDTIRVGRFVFGAIMLVGAAIIAGRVASVLLGDASVARATRERPMLLWLLGGTWSFALLGRVIAEWFARVVPVRVSGPTSFMLAAVGVALLLPVTLHVLVFGVAGNWRVHDLEIYACAALAITAVAHAGFAIMVGKRALALAREETPRSVTSIFVWTVVLAAVPFGIFYMLPSVFVAVTGIPIVPLLVWMDRLAKPHRDPMLPMARMIA